MKTFRFACCLAFVCASAWAAEVDLRVDISKLSWLEGLWTGSRNGVEFEERWTSVKGQALLALHREVKNGRMSAFEFLRIDSTKEGVFYFSSPNSAKPTPFKLVELAERRVAFENKTHDFPQRILYWLDGQGALHARIEGSMDGKIASEEWVWTKAR